MGLKRYAEIKSIGKKNAVLYRKSFKYYTEKNVVNIEYILCDNFNIIFRCFSNKI